MCTPCLCVCVLEGCARRVWCVLRGCAQAAWRVCELCVYVVCCVYVSVCGVCVWSGCARRLFVWCVWGGGVQVV